MKNKKLFLTSLFLILFIFSNILVTSTLLLFKCSNLIISFIFASLLTLIISVIVSKKNSLTNFEILKILGLLILIIVSSIMVSGKIYDVSWDGVSYHKTAIGQLRYGWNPVYESADEFNNKMIAPIKLNNTHSIWEIIMLKVIGCMQLMYIQLLIILKQEKVWQL